MVNVNMCSAYVIKCVYWEYKKEKHQWVCASCLLYSLYVRVQCEILFLLVLILFFSFKREGLLWSKKFSKCSGFIVAVFQILVLWHLSEAVTRIWRMGNLNLLSFTVFVSSAVQSNAWAMASPGNGSRGRGCTAETAGTRWRTREEAWRHDTKVAHCCCLDLAHFGRRACWKLRFVIESTISFPVWMQSDFKIICLWTDVRTDKLKLPHLLNMLFLFFVSGTTSFDKFRISIKQIK